MNTMIDTDVHNMGQWGILFQDCPVTFHGEFRATDFQGKGNVWNYIDEFGLTNPDTYKPEHRFGGGDTPIFWNAWNETTTRLEGQSVYNRWEYINGDWSPMADWERELLGTDISIGLALAGSNPDILELLLYRD